MDNMNLSPEDYKAFVALQELKHRQKQKRIRIIVIAVGVLFVLWLIGMFVVPKSPSSSAVSADSVIHEITTQESKPTVQNFGFNGEVIQVEDWFQQNLNDPSSVKDESWGKVIHYGIPKGTAVLEISRECQGYRDSLRRKKDSIGTEWKGEIIYAVAYSKSMVKYRITPNDAGWYAWIDKSCTKLHRDDGTRYSVRVQFRAKNAFGGYVLSIKTFCMDSAGNIIKVEDD